MKKLIISLGLICLFLLTGCGHNIAHIDRGIGLDIRVPIPFSGEDLVSVRLGQIDSTSLILRGNTEFSSQSKTAGSASIDTNTAATGKSGADGGITQEIKFTTGPQLNEGYLRDVLTSSNITKEDKALLIQYFVQQKKNEQMTK